MTIAREEIFGRCCASLAMTHRSAVEIASDTDYGLAGFVSGADLDKAREVARKIRAGWVTINHAFDMNAASAATSTAATVESGASSGSTSIRGQEHLGYAPEKAAQ